MMSASTEQTLCWPHRTFRQWPTPLQVHLSQKRGEHNAKQCVLQAARDAQAEREDQRLLRLQCGAAGKTNRSGDHFDIVQLSYHNSSGGRDLKFRVGLVACLTQLLANVTQALCRMTAGCPLLPLLCRMTTSSTRPG